MNSRCAVKTFSDSDSKYFKVTLSQGCTQAALYIYISYTYMHAPVPGWAALYVPRIKKEINKDE